MTSASISTVDSDAIPCSASPNTEETSSSIYVGKGKTIELTYKDKSIKNLDLYIIGSTDESKNNNVSKNEQKIAIIVVYDIFGWQENCSDISRKNGNPFEFCDMISNAFGDRYVVVMANHFRGKPWAIDSESWDGIAEFIGPSFKSANEDMHHLILPYVKNTMNISECVVLGQCFGGKICFNQCHQSLNINESDRCFIRALVSLHGSRITEEDVENIAIPVFYVQTSNDFDLKNVERILKKKEFGNLCKYELSEHPHGFSGSRGDYSDPKFKQNVIQVLIENVKGFLSTVFVNDNSKNTN